MNVHSNPVLFPLTPFTLNAAAGQFSVDVSDLPAGRGQDPASVDAFLLDFVFSITDAGAAIPYKQLAQIVTSAVLSSEVYGDLYGSQLRGTDIVNVIAPYLDPTGFGDDSAIGTVIGAGGGAVTRRLTVPLIFRPGHNRLARGLDFSLPTVGFRQDSILVSIDGSATTLGVNNVLTQAVCTPYAVLSTAEERYVPSVRHWNAGTDANAEIKVSGRPYGFFGLCGNLLGMGGQALSNYTAIQIARGDLYNKPGVTPEMIFKQFLRTAMPQTLPGTATGRQFPYDGITAVPTDGSYLSGTASVILPLLWERMGAKLSKINRSMEALKINTTQTAPAASRYIWSAYNEQTEAFVERMSGLFGLTAANAREKLIKPARDRQTGVKVQKTRLLPFTLG